MVNLQALALVLMARHDLACVIEDEVLIGTFLNPEMPGVAERISVTPQGTVTRQWSDGQLWPTDPMWKAWSVIRPHNWPVLLTIHEHLPPLDNSDKD